MELAINNQWQTLLEAERDKTYFKKLKTFVEKEYQEKIIYPKQADIFQAFEWTPFEQVKVVILGQDPYHGPNQAHGLSFSVLPGNKIPPSLRNIYKELTADLGIPAVSHGYLESWAKEGVLLLNTVLTVEEGKAHSHRNQGWEKFTDAAIQHLNQERENLIFILWGKPAQEKSKMIDLSRHKIIASPHPSPLSAYRGFFGTAPFSKTNQLLRESGNKEISWQLPITV